MRYAFPTLAIVLGLAAVVPVAGGAAYAGDTPASIDPGFDPGTGQINPGTAPRVPSAAPALPAPPSQQDARAALMMPDPGLTSLGGAPAPAQTTGVSPSSGAAQGANVPAPPPGPIGATMQTMPSKFSQRNDVLDRVPIKAWPLPLSDQQQKQIYQAVMADKSQPAAGADELKPAAALSADQAANGMHPLPANLRGIDGLQKLYFVKGKKKVLLVEPSTRTVVDEITS